MTKLNSTTIQSIVNEEIEIDTFEKFHRPMKYENSEFAERNSQQIKDDTKKKEINKLRKLKDTTID